jgi:hypothetical protein
MGGSLFDRETKDMGIYKTEIIRRVLWVVAHKPYDERESLR